MDYILTTATDGLCVRARSYARLKHSLFELEATNLRQKKSPLVNSLDIFLFEMLWLPKMQVHHLGNGRALSASYGSVLTHSPPISNSPGRGQRNTIRLAILTGGSLPSFPYRRDNKIVQPWVGVNYSAPATPLLALTQYELLGDW